MVSRACTVAASHPSFYLVCGTERSDFVDVAPDGRNAVLQKGGWALAQQKKAAVLAALQPCAPKFQAAINHVDVVQQPEKMNMAIAYIKSPAQIFADA